MDMIEMVVMNQVGPVIRHNTWEQITICRPRPPKQQQQRAQTERMLHRRFTVIENSTQYLLL